MYYRKPCYRHWALVLLSALSPIPSAEAAIAIDEVLADPPSGIKGDANQDGVRQTYADEFIELVNTGTDTVSLAGWRLGDDDAASLFTFPDSTRLPPGGRLVLFGGGAPANFSVPVFTDDGRIGNGLSNGGDMIILFDATAHTAASATASPTLATACYSSTQRQIPCWTSPLPARATSTNRWSAKTTSISYTASCRVEVFIRRDKPRRNTLLLPFPTRS